MYDQTINSLTIRMSLAKGDFSKNPALKHNAAAKEKVVTDAIGLAQSGYSTMLGFKTRSIKSKPVYSFTGLPENLVARKLNQNIRFATRIKQANRDSIVSNLKRLLAEGIPHRIYKLDISSFYESVLHEEAIKEINENYVLNGQTKRIVRSLLSALQAMGVNGLPRGLALSAALAELVMAKFDAYVRHHAGVCFYARFVDDIIIITNSKESEPNFIADIGAKLSPGLAFHPTKRKIISLNKVALHPLATPRSVLGEFSYLGYKFSIFDPFVKPKAKPERSFRDVQVDISDSKKNKIKTKITRALLKFAGDGKYELLRDRLKLLSSNYNILDRENGFRIRAGIYFNYHHVDFSSSSALPELDRYLQRSLDSKGFLRPPTRPHSLSKTQRNELRSLSFSRGFEKRIFNYFSPRQQKRILRCWSHV